MLFFGILCMIYFTLNGSPDLLKGLTLLTLLAFLALFESFLRTAEHTKPVTKTKSRETQIGTCS